MEKFNVDNLANNDDERWLKVKYTECICLLLNLLIHKKKALLNVNLLNYQVLGA